MPPSKGRKHIDSSKKYYFEDVGLRAIDGSCRKIVLVRDVVKPLYDDEDILTMSVYDFFPARGAMCLARLDSVYWSPKF